jgi:hypothetical protein
MKLKHDFFSSLIIRYCFFLLTVFFFTRAAAQNVTDVSGIIVDSTSGKPLNRTTLIRLSDNKVFFTDTTGTFYITCTPNDAIRISYVGFKTLRMIVTNVPDSSFGLKKFIRVEMSLNIRPIKGAIIVSEERPRQTDSVFYSQALRPIDATIMNPISLIYSQYSKKELEKSKLTEILQQKYIDDVLNYRLPKQSLLNLTGDKDFTISVLKARCQPSDFFILNTSDYELYNWVKACYAAYKRETGRQR